MWSEFLDFVFLLCLLTPSVFGTVVCFQWGGFWIIGGFIGIILTTILAYGIFSVNA